MIFPNIQQSQLKNNKGTEGKNIRSYGNNSTLVYSIKSKLIQKNVGGNYD